VFLDFHIIPKPFLFQEGHLIQPIYLEKADNPLRINWVDLQESDQMLLSHWTGGV
jgi:hypothetical protein